MWVNSEYPPPKSETVKSYDTQEKDILNMTDNIIGVPYKPEVKVIKDDHLKTLDDKKKQIVCFVDQNDTEYNDYKECGEKSACCGLDNLGNTCFMSSALQCMSNCKEFTTFMLSNKWIKDVNTVNQIGSQGKILCAYAKL